MCLCLIDQPVVLGMEDRVDRSQADVFVRAAIAGDVVRVEQFVVVGQVVAECVHRLGVSGVGVRVRLEDPSR